MADNNGDCLRCFLWRILTEIVRVCRILLILDMADFCDRLCVKDVLNISVFVITVAVFANLITVLLLSFRYETHQKNRRRRIF